MRHLHPAYVRLEFPEKFRDIGSEKRNCAQRRRNRGRAPRKRILLVEDESLIAMMMEQALRDLDLDVVGPFGTVHEALAAIERERIDAGILDINLGGEMAYPIARLLQARNVPFVFMTGYGAETIAAPFPGVQIFQKPLEREMLHELFVADVREPNPGCAKWSSCAGLRG